MKKKFLTLIFTLTAMLMCIFSLTACGDTKISFKLNFVVDNEIYATIDTSGDEVIALPENPTKENHSFDGWFWDKDVWEKPFTTNSLLDAPLSSDMSVYAKFSLNTINGVTFEDIETTYDGTEKTIAVSNLPNGASVVYDKANTYTNAGEYTVTATISQENQEDLQLTAVLTINKATYDMSGVVFTDKIVIYNSESHSITATNLPDGVTAQYTGNNQTYAGEYTVTATFTGDSANYELIPNKTATLKINQAVHYIKEVSCNQSLNVYSTVELIADTEVAGTIVFDNGQTLTLGYKTYSWTFVPEDTHNYTTATGTVGLTVCALVSYYNDGVLFSSQNIVLNNSATVPTGTPLRADKNGYRYTFSHWSIEENGAEYNFTNAITEDLNLYAVYDSEEIVYAINYYNTKGVEHENIATYTVSTQFTLLSLEKEHYVFNGWTDKDGNEVTKINKGTFGTLDLYATWTPIEYAITYDLGYRGAVNGSNPTTYNVEDTFSFACATYDEYHTFVGWYLDEKYVNEKSSVSVGESGEITLYAKWNFSGTYISTASELQNMAYNMTGVYELENDIDLKNFNWISIGSEEYPFKGYFNGAGQQILNLTSPIFIVSFGILKDVILSSVSIALDTDVGSLTTINNGVISNCETSGSVFGKYNVGGIVGKNTGSITYCKSYCNISGTISVGLNDDKQVYVGGLVGYNSGEISFCSVRNSINVKVSSSNCYSGLTCYVGGIVGVTSGKIFASSYAGEISNTCNNYTTDKSYSYSPGQYYYYPSHAYLGGIAGRTSTDILNCYANIESAYIEAYNQMWIAGIVGECGYINNQKTHINNCYAILENVSCVCTHPTYSPKPIYLAGITAGFSYGEINNCVSINRDIVKNQGNIVVNNSYNKQTLMDLQTSDYVEFVLNWGIYDSYSSVDNGYVWILIDGNLPKLFFE